MLHDVKFTLVINSQLINSFTYICNPTEMNEDQLAERIKYNYRNISGVPVTSVQINRVKLYQVKG